MKEFLMAGTAGLVVLLSTFFKDLPKSSAIKTDTDMTYSDPAPHPGSTPGEHYGYMADSTQPIGILELRNYVTKEGTRDRFIAYFEKELITSQQEMKGYPLSGYRVVGSNNNFCWLRGFKNWQERSTFLPRFYTSPAWLKHRDTANSMLANNDNVYLLHPLGLQNGALAPIAQVPAAALTPKGTYTVIDIYIANTKRERLKSLLAQSYLPIFAEGGVLAYTLWESEATPNDFPRLPVFQDPNVVVQISFYKDEASFKAAQLKIHDRLTTAQKEDLQDAITQHQLWILQPTAKSIRP